MKNWYKELEFSYLSFPKDVQILNMVSDLEKARKWTATHPDTSRNHLYRALILLDYIIADPKWCFGLGELLRFREAIGSVIDGKHPMASFDQLIQTAKLFDQKAYKAFLIPAIR